MLNPAAAPYAGSGGNLIGLNLGGYYTNNSGSSGPSPPQTAIGNTTYSSGNSNNSNNGMMSLGGLGMGGNNGAGGGANSSGRPSSPLSNLGGLAGALPGMNSGLGMGMGMGMDPMMMGPDSGEEVSTLFVIGFPEDYTEREFQNMFTFANGYESAALKRQDRKQVRIIIIVVFF